MKDYTNSQISPIIDEHIHNQKHREILKMRFIDGCTYEVIAEAVDRSPRQISNIISKDVLKIEKYLS